MRRTTSTAIIFSCLCATLSLTSPAIRADATTAADDDKTIKKFEETWARATKDRDTAAIEQLFSADYIQTGPGGHTSGKQEFIDRLKDGTMQLESSSFDQLRVRTYGATTVVTGVMTSKGQISGHDISGDYRFTQVLVRHGAAWEAVAIQFAVCKQ